MDVKNPTDSSISLILKEKDKTEIDNLYSRLDSYIDSLSPLFERGCTKETAKSVWKNFFNHEYWETSCVNENITLRSNNTMLTTWVNTEEFIEDKFSTIDKYSVHISCLATGDGYSMPRPLSYFGTRIPRNLSLTFKIDSCSVPEPYDIWWKIRNVGKEAKRRNDIRGQITKGGRTKIEKTVFVGPHYAECFIIKNGVCVAQSRIDVPIGQ